MTLSLTIFLTIICMQLVGIGMIIYSIFETLEEMKELMKGDE